MGIYLKRERSSEKDLRTGVLYNGLVNRNLIGLKFGQEVEFNVHRGKNKKGEKVTEFVVFGAKGYPKIFSFKDDTIPFKNVMTVNQLKKRIADTAKTFKFPIAVV